MTDTNIYTRKKINLADAPAGSGKTYAACKKIQKQQQVCNTVYVAPSIILLNQTQKQLQEFGVEPTIINCKTNEKNVAKAIMNYLAQAEPCGEVLLITWKSFYDLPYFHGRENWRVIVDEIPMVDRLHDFKIPFNHKFITDYIEIDVDINEQLATVKAINSRRLKGFLEKPEDDVQSIFVDLFKDVLNPNVDVFVDLNSWSKLIDMEIVEKNGNMLYFISMMKPDILYGSTLMSANASNTLLYDWFTRYHEVEFINAKSITDNLRYDNHEIADRLKISYFLEGKSFSKKVRDGNIRGEEKNVMDEMERGVTEILDGQDFLFVANNDYKNGLSNIKNSERMPVICHGLNQYQDYDNIVFLAALNRKSIHYKLLYALGFSSNVVDRATQHETLYQNILRTSLRNPDSDKQVHVIVASSFEANYLVDIFGQAEVKRIGEIRYKKLKALNNREKVKRYDAKKRLKKTLSKSTTSLKDSPKPNSISRSRSSGEYLNKTPPQLHKEDAPDNEQETVNSISNSGEICMTWHGNIHNQDEDEFHPVSFDNNVFVSTLRDQSGVIRDTKENMMMINPSIFVSRDPDGLRRDENYICSNQIILDFDSGEMSIEDFEKCFQHEAGRGLKRSFIICNSFSRSTDNPNRFRVFMPYAEPITSIDQHKAIFDSISQRITQYVQNKLGMEEYTKQLKALVEENESIKRYILVNKLSGLDRSCRKVTQSFYIPCINREHPESAYFKVFNMKTRDLTRCAIKPKDYLRTAVTPLTRPKVVEDTDAPLGEIDREEVLTRIDDIKNEYLNVAAGQGLRNSAFYNAALRLYHLGLPWYIVESNLYDLAGSDKKMIQRIKDVKKSLGKILVFNSN